MLHLRDLSELARRRPVVRNALALALAGGTARLFDAAYRVAVARLIGPETVGLLQMASSVYAFALGLATLGLSPALAHLIGADCSLERPAVATARSLALPAGGLSALLLLACAPWISRHVLSDPRALAPLRVLAAGLIPAAFCGVLRGRFQGTQRMLPLACAQVVEPAVRLGLAALIFALPVFWPIPAPLAPAVLLALVAVLGEGVDTAFLGVWTAREGVRRTDGPADRRRRGGHAASARETSAAGFSPALAGRLLRLSLPIVLGQFLFSAVAVADASLVPRLLQASGLTAPEATREYGLLHGMVLPFLFFPMTLVFPISAVLVPAIAEARAAGDLRLLRRRIRLAVWVTVALEAGAGFLYLAFPDGLAGLVGGGERVADLIRGLAIWVPFAYLDHIGASALIGLGATRGVLLDGILNAAVRLSLCWLLVPHPALGVKGVLLALAAGDAAATAAHFARLGRVAQWPPRNRRNAL